MKHFKSICILVIAMAVLLAACSGKPASAQPPAGISTPQACATPESGASVGCKKGAADTQPLAATPAQNETKSPPPLSATPLQDAASADLTRTDSQGAVSVEVKPLNLENPGETLDFELSMNTHSIDLSMDLTALATLTTDTGLTVQGNGWDGPNGGHHVEGKLSFPAISNGKPFLEGAKELTLTIKNVDAPTRLFTWQLTK